MTIALRVSDMKATLAFFQDVLGMSTLPFQLARVPGSQFEAQQPPNSVYVGYSPDTLGILLLPAEKGTKVEVGSQLRYIKIVYDDTNDSKTDTLSLPPAALKALQEGGTKEYLSPDGYRFVLVPYSVFNKQF